jgi:succinylglutamate desuccinylase
MSGSYSLELNFLTEIPQGFLKTKPEGMHALLGGPSLIHLAGKKKNALFISCLLHGNETTSISVIQKILAKYLPIGLPRDIIIFIGNTSAAVRGMRHLPGQIDYNRIWEKGTTPEHLISAQVTEYAEKQNLFASIDIHNNTGKNPNYGCINSMEPHFLDLASYFGSHTVFFTEPHNVQSLAFSRFCTSMTIEAGLSGSLAGINAGFNLIEDLLVIDKLRRNPQRVEPDVYHTIARMMVHPEARINFEDIPSKDIDLSFVDTLDSNNFEVIPKNCHLGYGRNISFLRVEDNSGRDVTDDFFRIENDEIFTNCIFIPSMFTKDIYVMKEDCLGYVMEVMVPAKTIN